MGLKYKIGFTTGTFDMLHYGHLLILQRAKAQCEKLIVGVSTGELIKTYKGLPPIINLTQRKAMVEALKCVDKVLTQSELVSIQQFMDLKADVFFLGDDWKENYTNEGINWLRDNNKIIWLPYTHSLSSSKIKEKIIKNSYQILTSQLKRK